MKKAVALIVLMMLALAGYIAAGPYLAIRGISQAIEQQDAAKLERYVDFPRLRVNLKAQLDDSMVRHAGSGMQSNPLGAFALQLASRMTGAGVDTLVTPLGIGALLQGHSLWNRASGDTIGGDSYARPTPARPLQHAKHRFESTTRFTATITPPEGTPTVAVLTRQGLTWKLTDIRLPL